MQEPLTQDTPSGSSVLSRVATELKASRIQRGLSIDDASRILLIQKAHLEKLEAGDFTFFPGAYIFAYIKEYLREMELGDEELLDACRRELSVSTGLKRSPSSGGRSPELSADFRPTRLQAAFDFLLGRPKAAALVAGTLLVLLVVALASGFFRSPEPMLAPAPEPSSAVMPDSALAPAARVEPSVTEPAPVPLAPKAAQSAEAVAAPLKPSLPPAPSPAAEPSSPLPDAEPSSGIDN
ncbi:helix-turn-helix transcriptional regulator [Chlorobium sp. N1]|uniref:helix-turn-helix domain-containing protein n=1 Tax=Chlorobium sp. N1 TaxID=2491138 RepID=UPI001039C83C|nr:helix-turn-helix transcriptional regulator [Chlorobium sp. N1]TCD47813.1 helix-turn-helix domain-containing protein [Chlorobium sp. N1]